MKILFCLLFSTILLSGCSIIGPSQPLFQTPPVMPTIQPLTSNTPVSTVTPVSQTPAAKCQSRLIGRITDVNNKIMKDAIVDIVSGAVTARATSDDYGQYGFAGLCGGIYSLTVTIPGQTPRVFGDRIAIDGANPAKFDVVYK